LSVATSSGLICPETLTWSLIRFKSKAWLLVPN
jgi:hypothetical protein